ncbi:hypothetical protein C8Q79DRAFT_636679 [Trametes meyenii]|nr:hypothetical protein C8Q79DRAFT_636679 [Trametes meyenii]
MPSVGAARDESHAPLFMAVLISFADLFHPRTLESMSATSVPTLSLQIPPSVGVHSGERSPSIPPSASRGTRGEEPGSTTTTPATRRVSLRDRLRPAGRSGRASSSQPALTGLLVFLAFALAQAVVTIVLTVYASRSRIRVEPYVGQTEFALCRTPAIVNLLWLVRTVAACYLMLWSYRMSNGRRLNPDRPVSRYGLAHLHYLIAKWMWIANLILFLIPAIYLVQPSHWPTCFHLSPYVTALTLIILIVAIARPLIDERIWHALSSLGVPRAPGTSHPTQWPPTQSDIDHLPLVLYIPPPPPDFPASPTSLVDRHLSSPLSVTRLSPGSPRRSRRFIFFKSRSQTAEGDVEHGAPVETLDGVDLWDATWQPGPYPFVRLPENRAICSICLEEFEAPKKVSDVNRAASEEANGEERELALVSRRPAGGADVNEVTEVQVRVQHPSLRDAPVVERAAAGRDGAPQPLRLLRCGHAFHKDCLDQWLSQQWRCPVCRLLIEM